MLGIQNWQSFSQSLSVLVFRRVGLHVLLLHDVHSYVM
ncbi:hypothetical protein DWUX_427 [Desulfovibrio diazotrophicus]|nr:hypothetical protein DWUX_427 [Desulfovibrio diazotrophicus]